MRKETVAVREFFRNYQKYKKLDKTIFITNHGKPEGVYQPFNEWEKNIIREKKTEPKKFTLKELKKYCFKGGDPNLSQNIDEILYG